MTKPREATPPRLARTLIRWTVPRDHFESVDGNLHELFDLRVDANGLRFARARYWHDALSVLVRSRLFRQRHGNLGARSTPTLHQIVLTLRGLVRQPGFSAIAILTLALRMGLHNSLQRSARVPRPS